MDRRKFLISGLAGIGATTLSPWIPRALGQGLCAAPPRTGYAMTNTGERIYYEVYGPEDGPPLFLVVPVYATTRLWTDAYLRYFTDKYSVMVADYPPGGRSDNLKDPKQFTADRVCEDYLSIADAGFGKGGKFAIAGYSWGGNSTHILSTRTDRLLASAVGGWPALGGPWKRLLEISEELNSEMYTTYYKGMQDWDERNEVKAVTNPRLNYVDRNDHGKFLGQEHSTSANMIKPFRQNRATLKSWAWDTRVVDGGVAREYGHTGGIRPDVACPVIRSFLDTYLDGNARC